MPFPLGARRGLQIAAAIICLAAAVLTAAHLPPIRGRILQFAVSRAARAGVILRAERLDYNLLTLSFRADEVSVASASAAGAPMFSAKSVHASLPWRAVTGRLAFARVDIISPHVVLRRDVDGRDNWTLPAAGEPSSIEAVHVERVTIRDALVEWTDDRAGVHVDAAFSTDLAPSAGATSGAVVFPQPTHVSARGQTTTVAIDEGRVAWDDRDLSVRATLRAVEGRVEIDGRIERLLSAPHVDIAATADASLPALSPWLSLAKPIDGRARLSARITNDSLTISELRAGVAGGEVTGRATVGFGGSGAADIAWNELDVSTIASTLASTHSDVLPASRAAGTLRARWSAGQKDGVDLSADVRLAADGSHASRRGVVPVAGNVTLELRNGRWRAATTGLDALGFRVAGGLEGRVNFDEVGRSSIAGRVRVASITTDWPNAVSRAGLIPLPRSLRGDASAEFVVDGTLASPAAHGDVQAALADATLPPVRVRTRVAATLDAVAVSDIDAQLSGASLRGALRWSSVDDRVAGHAEATVTLGDLPAFGAVSPAAIGASGVVEASATIDGPAASPAVAVHVAGSQLAVAGQAIDRLSAELRLRRHDLIVDRVAAAIDTGQLDGSGMINLADASYDAHAAFTNLRLQPLVVGSSAAEPMPLSAVADATIDGAGTWDNPKARGRVTLTDATWGATNVGSIDADLSLAERVATLELRAPDVALNGRATIGIDSGASLSATANWTPSDLAEIARRFGVSVPVTGSASAIAEWTGPRDRPADGRGSLRVDGVDATVDGQRVQLLEAGRIDVDGEAVRVSRIVLGSGDARMTIDGSLPRREGSGRIALTATGSLADIAALQRFAQSTDGGVASGSVDARLFVDGTLSSPAISAALRVSEGRVPIDPSHAIERLEIAAEYDAGILRVDRASAAFEGAVAEASARVPSDTFVSRLPASMRAYVPAAAGPATFQADVRSMTARTFAPFVAADALGSVDVSGDVAIRLDADALALDRVRGSIALTRADASVGGIALRQSEPSRVSVADGRLTIDAFRWTGRDQQLVLSGGVALTGDPTIDVTATAGVDLRLVSAFVPSVRTTGRADAEVRIRGALRDPAIDGFVTLADAEARIAEPRTVIDNVSGTVTFAGDTIVLERITGSINGGYVEVAGSLRRTALTPSSGVVTLQAEATPLDLEGVRVEADAHLTWTVEEGASTLAGTVTVVRGAYRDRVSIGQLFAAVRSTTPTSAAAQLLDRTRLDVRITTDEDLLVDNNLARLSMRADVRAVGTVARPSVTGRLTLSDGGVVYFNGTRYRIEEGSSIDFSNPARVEPDLDVKAVARVQGDEITLTLTGTPATLQTKLESDNPNLSESDKVALLLFGRTASPTDADPSTGAEVLGLVAGGFLDAAGRAVGLDTARLERGTPDVRFDAGLVASETNPGARFTFGKTIGRWDVVFSQSLQQSGGLTWIVGYKPGAAIDLRVVSLDTGDRLYTFGHDVSFGAHRRQTTAAARSEVRVGAVALTGAGADEAAVRALLRLQPDDRFDFFRWQDDRDRLERFYLARGRYEARIAARRQPMPDDPRSVQLLYDVRRGRPTRIAVTGYRLPQRGLDAIQRAWSRSVADEFLVDEAAGIVRSEMAAEGFLLPSIAIHMESSQQEKVLQVLVEPGARASDRRVEIAGNVSVPRSTLLDVVARNAPPDAVWVEPDRARDALAAFYRAQGRLDATVRIAPIAMAGTTATRTIVIDERAQYRVAAVRLDGVRAFDAASARVAGLAAGEPYTDARLQAAQAALEAQYRQLGFNRVSIDGAARVAGDAQVDVAIHVDEGPQQRLRDVRITGVSRTNPALIARALRLDVGAPVDLAEWNAARRRLYGTGVFRSVDIQREPIDAPHEATEEPVRAAVTIEEWPPLHLRYGVEVSDRSAGVAGDAARAAVPTIAESGGRDFGVGVAAGLDARSLFGTALTAGVSGRYTPDMKAARIYATSPVFRGRPITTNVFLERSAETVGATAATDEPVFETVKNDFTVEQRVRIRTGTTLSYLFTIERNRTRQLNPNPFDPLPFDVTVTTGNLGSSLLVDRRNDLNDASRGWFHASTFEYSPGAFASDVRFVRYFAQQSVYVPVGTVVFAGALRLGLATAFDATLTPDRRFFAGGGNSVRGYELDVLSPGFENGVAVGGNALTVLNGELRFPVFRWVRGVAFADAGRAFPRVSDISLRALSASSGGGLRVQTPFALLRVDAGVPFDATYGPRRVRWFFSIGQLF